MSLIDKAKELSDGVVEKVGDMASGDVIANTIIRVAEKQDRVNQILAEQGSEYRICGFEIENSIPPKAVFTVTRETERGGDD